MNPGPDSPISRLEWTDGSAALAFCVTPARGFQLTALTILSTVIAGQSVPRSKKWETRGSSC